MSAGFLIFIAAAITTVMWLSIEYYLYRTKKPLITDKVREWSRANLLIPWSGGLVMGALGAHFWWCGA